MNKVIHKLSTVSNDGTVTQVGEYHDTEQARAVAVALHGTGAFNVVKLNTEEVWTGVVDKSAGVVDKPKKQPKKEITVKSFKELAQIKNAQDRPIKEKLQLLNIKITATVAGDAYYVRRDSKFIHKAPNRALAEEFVNGIWQDEIEKAYKNLHPVFGE